MHTEKIVVDTHTETVQSEPTNLFDYTTESDCIIERVSSANILYISFIEKIVKVNPDNNNGSVV